MAGLPRSSRFPRRPDERGRPPQSGIGVYAHQGVSFIDDAPAIRNALAAKHHAYGDPGAPFVVAVGTYIHAALSAIRRGQMIMLSGTAPKLIKIVSTGTACGVSRRGQ
jgi:hypothetical protein